MEVFAVGSAMLGLAYVLQLLGTRPLSRRCLIAGTTTVLRCTLTIGISLAFHHPDGFEAAMQEADAALYRGKAAGRNRVEWGVREGARALAVATGLCGLGVA